MTELVAGENFAVPSSWPAGTWGMMTSIGVAVANLHWKADPKKRLDPTWFPVNTTGLSALEIRREFDLDWTVTDGQPVFPSYDAGKHGSSEVLKAAPGLTMYVGYDFGLNPAAVFVQPSDMGQVRVLRAINEENKDLSLFAPLVIRQMLALNQEAGFPVVTLEDLQTRFEAKWRQSVQPGMTLKELESLEAKVWQETYKGAFDHEDGISLHFVHIGDPAGKSRSANDAKSAYTILASRYGLKVQGKQKHQIWNTRRNAVTSLLVASMEGGEPKLLVSAHASCERLRAGFEGSYAYDENADSGGKETPLKDRFSHPQDAFQYVACEIAPAQGSGKPLGGAVSVDYGPSPRPAQPLPPETPVNLTSRWDGLELEEVQEVKTMPAERLPWPILQSRMPY